MHTLSAAMNLKNKAFGQLRGFDFNSFFNFAGRTFGASSAGLFEIMGKIDDEIDINAWFETVLSDWGSARLKRARAVILAGEFEGAVALDLIDGSGVVRASVDLGTGEAEGDVFVFRKTVPRTQNGRYWKFKIRNVDGSFIQIDQLEALFTLRPYGTSKSS